VAYCRLPVRATPKALCKTILDVYGDPHPSTLDDLVRSVRDAIRDHSTTALLIDDITRLRLHRGDDQDTLDLIRELMDLNVTLVLIGVDIPGSRLLRGAYVNPGTNQWVFPDIARGSGRNPAATERRFDLVDLDPFDYATTEGMNAFLEHLAGIEDQLRLLRAEPGMLTTGVMPEYLFRRTHGIAGLLRRLIEDGCAKAISTGEERLTPELLAGTAIRLGNLADLDPEAGEIPSIPQDVQPPKPPRNKAGKKPRNTVFDDHGDRSAADG
jgi:AAA domain